MQPVRKRIASVCALAVLLLVLPGFLHAQLTSENFKVEKYSVGSAAQTQSASSSNFDSSHQTGPLYSYDTPSEETDTDDASSSGGTAVGGQKNTDSEEETGTEVTPKKGEDEEPQIDPADQDEITQDVKDVEDTEDEQEQLASPDGRSDGDGGTLGSDQSATAQTADGDSSRESSAYRELTSSVFSQLMKAGEVASMAIQRQLERLEPLAPVVRSADAVGAGLGVFSVVLAGFQVPFSITNIGRVLLHAWTALIELFVLRKRRRPWGTVYDSVSKAPIDPAYVQLFDEDGNKQAEAITDLDGRYGFLIPDGTYRMQVDKTHYTFPSERVTHTGHDVLYNNLYLGGYVPVSDAVAYDIPLDPDGFDWNQYEKMRTHQTQFIHKLDLYLYKFFTFIFYAGAVVVVFELVSDVNVFSTLFFIIYILLFIAHFRRGRPRLYGTITQGDKVLAYAVVRIYQGDREVTSKVADAYGRYFALVLPDVYRIQVDDRVSADMYETVYESEIDAREGVINQHIRV